LQDLTPVPFLRKNVLSLIITLIDLIFNGGCLIPPNSKYANQSPIISLERSAFLQ